MNNNIEFNVLEYRIQKTLDNRLPNDTMFDYLGVVEDVRYEDFYDGYNLIERG